jgi:hypothetical protein
MLITACIVALTLFVKVISNDLQKVLKENTISFSAKTGWRVLVRSKNTGRFVFNQKLSVNAFFNLLLLTN